MKPINKKKVFGLIEKCIDLNQSGVTFISADYTLLEEEKNFFIMPFVVCTVFAILICFKILKNKTIFSVIFVITYILVYTLIVLMLLRVKKRPCFVVRFSSEPQADSCILKNVLQNFDMEKEWTSDENYFYRLTYKEHVSLKYYKTTLNFLELREKEFQA